MGNVEKVIEKYRNLAKEMVDNYLIVMVCNVKGKTNSEKNYLATPIDSEYYSLKQFEEISSAITRLGFSIKAYFDEGDFIREYSTGLLKDNFPKKIIVLNSAQKGVAEGRKSLVPAFCDLNNLMHTNSSAYISSFSRDKYHWYSLLENGGYNVAESWLYDQNSGWLFGKSPTAGKKVICKLNSECSSIGLDINNIFAYSKEHDSYIKNLSQNFNQRVIVQEFIEGREVEVPVIVTKKKGFCMSPVGIKIGSDKNLGNQILNYDIRGNNKFSFYDFSSEEKDLSEQICCHAEDIAYNLGIFGLGRIDFRIDEKGRWLVTDISTNPHITKSMSYYFAFKQLGYEYEDVLATLLGLSMTRKEQLPFLEKKVLPTEKVIYLKREMPSANEWIELRNKIGWNIHSTSVHHSASDSTLFGIIIYDEEKNPIGMGRVVGDGKICFYLQDIGVIPEWQNNRLGHHIMTEMISYVYEHAEPKSIVGLMASDKKSENFYKKFGFETRSHENKGEGMIKEIF